MSRTRHHELAVRGGDARAITCLFGQAITGRLRLAARGQLADLDGDGALDLVVGDFFGAELMILRGDGAGGFAEPVTTPSALGIDSIAVGDVDGDGALDVATRGAGLEIWVHPGDGAGGLGPPFVIDVAVSLPTGRIAPAEIDGDDRIDFVVSDPAGIGVMLTETHAGPRALRSWPGLAAAESTAMVGDLDGDGPGEVVVATAGGIAVFRDIGLPSRRIDALLGGPEPRVAAIADLDHDGHDEVIFGPTREGPLGALRWDGSRLRVDPVSAPELRAKASLHAIDLDGDGVVDLVADRGPTLALAYGIDAAHFEAPRTVGPAIEGSVRVGDLNGDGRPELLRQSAGALTILWNRAERSWGGACRRRCDRSGGRAHRR